MKKNILLLGLLITVQNSFAQCTEQKNFDITWKMDVNNVSYEIKRKDGSEFSYYNNPSALYPLYRGIKLDTTIKIPGKNYAIFMAYQKDDVDLERVEKLLTGNNNQLSYYVNSRAVSQTYKFPFEKNNFLTVKKIVDKFNVEQSIALFTRNNDIYWRHNIKYYIILFHDEYGRKCSYFESPEVKYNFGIKPGSLIWKDFWEK